MKEVDKMKQFIKKYFKFIWAALICVLIYYIKVLLNLDDWTYVVAAAIAIYFVDMFMDKFKGRIFRD